ncbi:hypothetical protein FACS189413_11700 [Bacteroidia bacterium]|nr:hypothetical protein FACS189413_11700 [Bacteroidia bacterium]
MKTKITFLLGVCALFFLSSCLEQAKIQVTNHVHNVRLENISFSTNRIGSNLYPGETTEMTIRHSSDENFFPQSAQLEFYMVKGDKRVYLKTKESFFIDEDETLKIVIDDATELINPMN